MNVQSLENAKQSLLDAYLELDNSLQGIDINSDSDPAIVEINNQKTSIQNAVGIISISIARINNKSIES